MISAAESAAVTNWPLRLLLVGVMFALLALVFLQIKRRWDRLKAESEEIHIPLAEEVPENFAAHVLVDGLFIGTSPSGDWMRRVMSQGLGVRSRAQLQFDGTSKGGAGIYFDRVGESSFYVPIGQILDAQFGRGVAGTVRAKDSVFVVRWRLGEAILDTGFRADTSMGHQELIDIVSRIHQVQTGVTEST